jgi:hypothetical protein
MNDAILVKAVAAQYVRDRGAEAIRYLHDMQELAASLPDIDSAQTWREIADAARAILLTATSGSSRPGTQAALPVPVPLG